MKTFENVDSCDWLQSLEASSDLSVLEATLNDADVDYLDAPEGCMILAAAEILIALQGESGEVLPEKASRWISAHSSLDSSYLNAKAVQAIDKVLSDISELNELWEDTDDFGIWVEDVTRIKKAVVSKG